jgi:hypothetical protein
LTLALDLSPRVEEKPGVDQPVILAGDLLPNQLAGFVIGE